ncbi:MAG TPA: universal stress protein [Candidatus Dormibacteraeota bacterium]
MRNTGSGHDRTCSLRRTIAATSGRSGARHSGLRYTGWEFCARTAPLGDTAEAHGITGRRRHGSGGLDHRSWRPHDRRRPWPSESSIARVDNTAAMKRIVVGVDGSEHADGAIDWAIRMAQL